MQMDVDSFAFLVDEAMRTMIRDGREEELREMLTDLVGKDAAAATVERLRARKSQRVPNRDHRRAGPAPIEGARRRAATLEREGNQGAARRVAL